MINYKIVNKKIKEVESITCDICGKNYKKEDIQFERPIEEDYKLNNPTQIRLI